jgi:hypothetical protein
LLARADRFARCPARYLDAITLRRPSAVTLQEHHDLGAAASQVKLNMCAAAPGAACLLLISGSGSPLRG